MYVVIVITNQAGIGRSFYTENYFIALTKCMRSKFVLNDATIYAVYFFPLQPVNGFGNYSRESYFKKPSPGMLLQAQSENNINMQSSIFVGGKVSDMEAGKRAGVETLVYLSAGKIVSGVICLEKLDEGNNFIISKQSRENFLTNLQ